MVSTRKSPEDPAKLYDIDTTKVGLDGNMWKVILTKNNQKRWQKVNFKKEKEPKQLKEKVERFSLKNYTVKKFNKNTFNPMLSKNYISAEIDPTGYYLSEKLDGARAIYYNGEFISRNNKKYNAPDWFSENFPKDLVLDGELFTKRNEFNTLISIIRKKTPIDNEWKKVTFVVFDLPMVKAPFIDRLKLMQTIKFESKYIRLIEHHLIENLQDLEDKHNYLVSQGAEGTMLNKPDSYYEGTRSSGLLKYKNFKDDEAVVEDFQFGEGRNSKVMGHLTVRWLKPELGKSKFDVGSGFTDEQRRDHKTLFPKGTIIKVKYFETNKIGIPRFPTFIGTIPKYFVH